MLFLLPGFLHKMLKRGKYRHKFAQRFGFYSKRVGVKLRSRDQWLWMHAVSVGEVLIGLKLIEQMKAMDPDLGVVLSTTTSTGYALANKSRNAGLEIIYNPVDFLWSVSRAVRAIRPSQLVLIEAEVWPNLLYAVKSRGVTAALVNARLSPRSESRYRKFQWLVRTLFRQLDAVCVQEEEDISKWLDLGVEREKIHRLGSVKFDDVQKVEKTPQDFSRLLHTIHISDERLILLGGSTHRGEEKILASHYSELRKTYPNLFLVIVPRHVERSREIQETLQNMGSNVILRSQIGKSVDPSNKPDLLIVDTTGDLRDWYRYATLVFVGKSLCASGGQNPAEAISAGKAVIFGPHMENFRALCTALLKEGGAIQVSDSEALKNTFKELLENPARRNALAEKGSAVLDAHRGACIRTATLLAALRSK